MPHIPSEGHIPQASTLPVPSATVLYLHSSDPISCSSPTSHTLSKAIWNVGLSQQTLQIPSCFECPYHLLDWTEPWVLAMDITSPAVVSSGSSLLSLFYHHHHYYSYSKYYRPWRLGVLLAPRSFFFLLPSNTQLLWILCLQTLPPLSVAVSMVCRPSSIMAGQPALLSSCHKSLASFLEVWPLAPWLL